jgi:hypothetical protein
MGELVAVSLWEARPISEQGALISAGRAQAASFEHLRLLWFGCLDVDVDVDVDGERRRVRLCKRWDERFWLKRGYCTSGDEQSRKLSQSVVGVYRWMGPKTLSIPWYAFDWAHSKFSTSEVYWASLESRARLDW